MGKLCIRFCKYVFKHESVAKCTQDSVRRVSFERHRPSVSYVSTKKLKHVPLFATNTYKWVKISQPSMRSYCPACRTSLIATRFWVVMICPIIKCLTVLEFSFILLDLCLFITIFNLILNYVPTVTFLISTYHKIWILLIIFCFIWNYWIIYFLTCLEVFWSVVS